MYDFTFYNPTRVIFGRGVFPRVADELSKDGISRVLLLYGGASAHRTGVYGQVASALRERGVAFFECPGVKPNPVVSKAREAIEMIKSNGIEAIVAIGGGSVIDSAKGIAAGALYDGDVWDFYSRRAAVERALPIYTIVTVSATASEMNYTSVLTNEELGHKVGLGCDLFYPRCTFIDPSVQFSVSERQTVDGGIDAICHVLETYFDGAPGLEIQKEYSEGLVRSVIRLLPILTAHPDDYNARAQFAWASVNALNGTTWAGHPSRGDFSSHAMGHTLSAKLDSVHGETLSVVMPAWMRYVCGEDMRTFARFADRVFGESEGSEEERALAGIARLKDFFASLGAPVTLRDMGLSEDDLSGFAAHVTRNGPIGSLKKLETEDVLKIFEMAY